MYDHNGPFCWCCEGFEGANHDERRERKSDFENSEDDRRTRIGNLKKKAINASSKFKHSLKKKGRRKSHDHLLSVSIKDVRDVEELQAVEAFRQALISDDLLPDRHDDYHMLLRSYNALPFSWFWLLLYRASFSGIAIFADFWKPGSLIWKRRSTCGPKWFTGGKTSAPTLSWR